MEIEYIYPDNNDDENNRKRFRQVERENTFGCLIISLFLLIGLFVFLSLLPFFLMILGYGIIILGLYIVYKAYIEEPVYRLISWLKSKR